jgi:hypothetical protein
MLMLFDTQVQLRMGQANVKKWVDDIMSLLTDDDPLGIDSFVTHTLPLDEAPHGCNIFQKERDGPVKIIIKPRQTVGLSGTTPPMLDAVMVGSEAVFHAPQDRLGPAADSDLAVNRADV